MGTDKSTRLSYHSTVSTCSIVSIFALMAAMSLGSMPSTTTREKAPLPNSSSRMSCPFTVSMSPGR